MWFVKCKYLPCRSLFTRDRTSHDTCYLACSYTPRVITRERQNVQFIIHAWLDIHENRSLNKPHNDSVAQVHIYIYIRSCVYIHCNVYCLLQVTMTPGACGPMIAISKQSTYRTRDQPEPIWCQPQVVVHCCNSIHSYVVKLSSF